LNSKGDCVRRDLVPVLFTRGCSGKSCPASPAARPPDKVTPENPWGLVAAGTKNRSGQVWVGGAPMGNRDAGRGSVILSAKWRYRQNSDSDRECVYPGGETLRTRQGWRLDSKGPCDRGPIRRRVSVLYPQGQRKALLPRQLRRASRTSAQRSGFVDQEGWHLFYRDCYQIGAKTSPDGLAAGPSTTSLANGGKDHPSPDDC